MASHVTIYALFTGLLLTGCAHYERGAHVAAINQSVQTQTGFNVSIEPRDARILSGTISMKAAARAALTGNPLLIAAFEDLNVASADEIQAGLLTNPVLDSEVTFFGGGARPALDISLALNISRIFSRSNRIKAAKAERKGIEAQVTGLIVQTVFDSQQALLSLWMAEQNLRLTQEMLIIRKAAADTAVVLKAAGNITAGEFAEHMLAWQQAMIALGGAEMSVITARETLATITGSLIGNDFSAYLDITALLEATLEGSFIDDSLENNFQLRAEQQRIKALGARLGLAKIDIWLEHLELEAVYEREEDASGEGFAVGVPIPLFDWGQARTGRATAMLSASEQRYKAMYLAARNKAIKTRQYVEKLSAAATSLNTAVLEANDESLAFQQQAFNAMQIGPFSLLQSKLRYFQTQMQVLNVQSLFISNLLAAQAMQAGVKLTMTPANTPMMSMGIAAPEGDH